MAEKSSYPSEQQERFIVRMPDGLRDRIAAAAKANSRSMNAEIVSTLMEAYPAPFTFKEMVARTQDLVGELRRAPSGQTMADLHNVLQEVAASLDELERSRLSRDDEESDPDQ